MYVCMRVAVHQRSPARNERGSVRAGALAIWHTAIPDKEKSRSLLWLYSASTLLINTRLFQNT